MVEEGVSLLLLLPLVQRNYRLPRRLKNLHQGVPNALPVREQGWSSVLPVMAVDPVVQSIVVDLAR